MHELYPAPPVLLHASNIWLATPPLTNQTTPRRTCFSIDHVAAYVDLSNELTYVILSDPTEARDIQSIFFQLLYTIYTTTAHLDITASIPEHHTCPLKLSSHLPLPILHPDQPSAFLPRYFAVCYNGLQQ